MRTKPRVQRSVAFCKLAGLYARKYARRDVEELTSLALISWLMPRKDGTLRTTKQAIIRAHNQLRREMTTPKLAIAPGDAWRDTNDRNRKLDKTLAHQASILSDVTERNGAELDTIIRLASIGYTSREIAWKRGIAQNTVLRRIREIVAQD